jgi:hypothetical protein
MWMIFDVPYCSLYRGCCYRTVLAGCRTVPACCRTAQDDSCRMTAYTAYSALLRAVLFRSKFLKKRNFLKLFLHYIKKIFSVYAAHLRPTWHVTKISLMLFFENYSGETMPFPQSHKHCILPYVSGPLLQTGCRVPTPSPPPTQSDGR